MDAPAPAAQNEPEKPQEPAPTSPRHSEAQLDALVDLVRENVTPRPYPKEKAQEPTVDEKLDSLAAKLDAVPKTGVIYGEINDAVSAFVAPLRDEIAALAAKLDALPAEVRKIVAEGLSALGDKFREWLAKSPGWIIAPREVTDALGEQIRRVQEEREPEETPPEPVANSAGLCAEAPPGATQQPPHGCV